MKRSYHLDTVPVFGLLEDFCVLSAQDEFTQEDYKLYTALYRYIEDCIKEHQDAVLDTRHIAELQEDGYGLQHPVSCRKSGPQGLIDCPINVAVSDQVRKGKIMVVPGRYLVTLDKDNKLSFVEIES